MSILPILFVEVLNSFKKQMGCSVTICCFSNEKFQGDDADYLGRCRHYQVDGCVIISGEEIEPSIKELDESDIPCIGVDIELFGEMSGHIMSDNYKMSSKVVEHFYLQGLRDLGFIGGARSLKSPTCVRPVIVTPWKASDCRPVRNGS